MSAHNEFLRELIERFNQRRRSGRWLAFGREQRIEHVGEQVPRARRALRELPRATLRASLW